jgi:hypothetical protein
MAMLASKTSFPTPLGSTSSNISASSAQSSSTLQSSRRTPALVTSNQLFASPTDSEFSDVEGPESAKNWNEDQVCDWLRSINCGDYEKIFKKNNINGENLLEMDKAVLQEMGIDKIGDRVRLFLGIKKLRTKAYANQKKRNRVSVTTPPSTTHTNACRTLLLVWVIMHTPLPPVALRDLFSREVEVYPTPPPTRDTQGSSKAILPDPRPQRTPTSILRGPAPHSQDQKFEQ